MTIANYINQPLFIPALLRLLSTTVLALLMTFVLFVLMKLLITPADEYFVPVERDLAVVELFEPPKETDPEIRKTLPPKPEITPPNMTLSHIDPVDTTSQVLVGRFTPDIGVTLDGPTLVNSLGNKMATPLVRVEPRFPTEALRQGIAGWVVLNFSIDETGSVTDINVLAAEPRNIFDREAIRALRRWKYQPQLVEGKPIKQTNLQVQLDFQLEQE